jgi:hypothetical protein
MNISFSAGQETPRLSLNPKVHYRVHNSPPLVTILSQIHLLHTFPIYFPKVKEKFSLCLTKYHSMKMYPLLN